MSSATPADAPLRIGFAGTPVFAREALAALHAAGHTLPLILSQPDRPAGRGMRLQASPVKQLALELGLPVAQPRSLRLDGKFPEDAAAARAALDAAELDVLVVAAYGLLLPQWALDTPRRGCLNIHASLLPRWRGAAPIQRAIEAGDALTGITIMQMDAGLDTGAMLATRTTPIGADDSSASLHDRLGAIGAKLIVETVAALGGAALRTQPQPIEGISYAAKIDKSEAAVDWRDSAAQIERRLRAFDPFPGASAVIGGVPLKLWRGRVVSQPGDRGEPGTAIAAGPDRLVIACGSDTLELIELQLPGGRRCGVREILQRHPEIAA